MAHRIPVEPLASGSLNGLDEQAIVGCPATQGMIGGSKDDVDLVAEGDARAALCLVLAVESTIGRNSGPECPANPGPGCPDAIRTS